MNLPCKVVEDLLPLYCDCLCSDETAALVEEHLKDCSACSRILAQLRTEFELSRRPVDDMKPLEALRGKWQKSRRDSLRKGICIAVSAMLMVALLLTGTWYFRYGKIFRNMAENMEKTGDAVFSGADYSREVEGCRLDLRLPDLLTDSGFARVTGEQGLEIHLYPEAGGNYRWNLYITDEDGRGRFLYLKADLTPDFDNHNTLLNAEAEKEMLRQLVAAKKEKISCMLEAVSVLWGIDLLEYSNLA